MTKPEVGTGTYFGIGHSGFGIDSGIRVSGFGIHCDGRAAAEKFMR
jgi:hypothetical protein